MWNIRYICLHLCSLPRRFVSNSRANISILFALISFGLVIGTGAGIDLARAYLAKQKLVEAATLACQYASRPSIIDTSTASYSGSNGGTAYVTAVDNFITSTLQSQHFQYTQTNNTPFSYTQNGPGTVTLNAVVPTAFMQIIGVKKMPVSATSHCYDTPSSPAQVAAGSIVLSEGFENTACAGTCYVWYNTSGGIGTQSSPVNTFTSTVAYTGSTGTQWYIMGYCLEVDSVNQILSSVPQGTHSAELDCDNGQGNAGNSSISTKAYLAAGNYELRYNFAARIDYVDYDPVYICGSASSDLSWASDTNATAGKKTNVSRTNQINTYLDLNTNGVPPTHTTIDGTQTLGGSNLIDMCVYSGGWIQRSVRIKVTTAGYYWLSFAADGTNDSFGGQIDNIMLCTGSCTGSVQDNFPSSWLSANNGGSNKVLFEDNFESPTYTGNALTYTNNTANMNNSYGTSGASSGWPNQTASGWTTAPYNEMEYEVPGTLKAGQTSGAGQGAQNITLDMYTSPSDNRVISRPFLLDPGYYQVNYDYISDVTFASLASPQCTAAPNATSAAAYAVSGSALGNIRLYPSNYYTLNKDTNTVGVFMSHALMASTPVGGGALGSQTSYNNPDGTVTTTPTVSPYAVTLSNYTTSGINPLIDICGYASTWQTRTTYVVITKPAYYWLTFAALGTADDVGGSIDDVKLTALGSLYMNSPPSNAVTIPVPSPQPSAIINYTGFFIVADPLEPPASPQ